LGQLVVDEYRLDVSETLVDKKGGGLTARAVLAGDAILAEKIMSLKAGKAACAQQKDGIKAYFSKRKVEELAQLEARLAAEENAGACRHANPLDQW
jgi:hypothetical protein